MELTREKIGLSIVIEPAFPRSVVDSTILASVYLWVVQVRLKSFSSVENV